MHRVLTKPDFPKGKKLEITDRDKRILWAVYRYRFVTTDQIQIFTNSPDRRSLNSRLRLLWAADYLARPAIQKEMYGYKDERPTIHALGQRGAEWLTENHNIRFPKGKGWNTANQIKSSNFLEHRLGAAETMFLVEKGLADMNGYRLLDRDEILLRSPKKTHQLERPFSLPTVIVTPDGRRARRSTIPDYIFGIADIRGEQERRALLFLEWDNATEDYMKSDPKQSSIMGKYLGYSDVYERGLHKSQYGFKNFRVLFVVNGAQERVAKMIATYQEVAAKRCPSGAFLHTTMDLLTSRGVFAPIWLTGKRERVSLL